VPIVKIKIYSDSGELIYSNQFSVDSSIVNRILEILGSSVKRENVEDNFNLVNAVLWALHKLEAYSEETAVDSWSIARAIASEPDWFNKASRYYGISNRRELVSRLSKAVGPVAKYLVKRNIIACKRSSRGRLYWVRR